MKKLLTFLLLTSLAVADTHTKSSGGTPPYASGGTTVNVLCKSNGSSQCSDSSIVDNGAGAITIPGAIANQGTLTVSQLATPANATLVVTGGVGTNYTYKLVAKAGSVGTAANSGVSTAVGPTTLDGTHFIDINFVSQTGCTSIDVYRTVGGAAQGKIGNVACTTAGAALTLRDNALVGDASTAPAVNTTGGLVSASLTEVPGTNFTSLVPIISTAAGTASLPAIGVGATNLGFFKSGNLIGVGIGTGTWAAFSNSGLGGVQVWSGSSFAWSSTGAADGTPDTWLTRSGAGIVTVANAATAGNQGGTLGVSTIQYRGLAQTTFVTSDFTTSGSGTALEAITGLTWTFPATTAINARIDCNLLYNQNVANVAVAFGFQDASVAPTNLAASGIQYTSATASTEGTLAASATTTATAVTSATPSAITTIWPVQLHFLIEQPSNASTSVFTIRVSTAAAADTVTIKRGSYCSLAQ